MITERVPDIPIEADKPKTREQIGFNPRRTYVYDHKLGAVVEKERPCPS